MRGKPDGITYYRQIADVIIKRIRSGQYAPGTRLPSDRKLGAEFGHNRHTVRRALDVVEEHHLITRHQGKGTFVVKALPPSPEKKHLTIGLIDTTRQLGTRPAARVIQVLVQSADQVADHLRLRPDEGVVFINRVRSIDHSPLIIEHIYVPQKLAPGLETFDLTQSLRDLMTSQFAITLARQEVTFESIPSDSQAPQLVGLPGGAPMLLEKRLSFTIEDTPCEYSEHIYRGDRFAFRLK